jgi:hypothetical protein
MATYLAGFLVTAALTGLWVWAVARYDSIRFPTTDLLLTVAFCSAIGTLPRAGWLVATMVFVMITLRVEQAEPWPDTVILAAAPMVTWFVAGVVMWNVIGV